MQRPAPCIGFAMDTDVLGVILAGGSSRRFGGDKARARLEGRPLLQWVVERARPQVDPLLLNSGDVSLGDPGIERFADAAPGEGPLAGILAGLAEAERRGFARVATFACDTPFFPDDTVTKLRDALTLSSADVVFARCGATSHRVFALWRTECRTRLAGAFASGCRALRDIERHLVCGTADFAAHGGPDGDPFFNINTHADLEAAQRWLAARPFETR